MRVKSQEDDDYREEGGGSWDQLSLKGKRATCETGELLISKPADMGCWRSKVESHHPAIKAWMTWAARLSLKEASQSGYIKGSDEAGNLRAQNNLKNVARLGASKLGQKRRVPSVPSDVSRGLYQPGLGCASGPSQNVLER